MNFEGLIPIVCGTIITLFALGVFPKNPKDPQKMAEWRRKFGPAMKIIGPLVVLFGLLELTGILK